LTVLEFSLLNIIGIPATAGDGCFPGTQAESDVQCLSLHGHVRSGDFDLYGHFLSADNDRWSLSGQLLLHTRWYLFPFAGLLVWRIYEILQKSVLWPGEAWRALTSLVLAIGFFYRIIGPPSAFATSIQEARVTISPDEGQALQYVRRPLPQFRHPGQSR
jgi:hypothetical protein